MYFWTTQRIRETAKYKPAKIEGRLFCDQRSRQEVCEESRYLIATPRMVSPVTRVRRAVFTAHMHTSDYQKGRHP